MGYITQLGDYKDQLKRTVFAGKILGIEQLCWFKANRGTAILATYLNGNEPGGVENDKC